jgi:uncharacterized protein
MSGEWREQVRRAALESAEAEARHLWKLRDEARIPFNHRWEHVQSVVGLALHLAAELHADRDVVEAAAWLHDVCKMKPDHAAAGARNAEEEKEPLQPLEAAILWDADKLSKLGVQSIIYVISAPYSVGRSMQARLDDIEEFVEEVLSRTVKSMNTEPAKRIAVRRYEAMVAALTAWEHEEKEGAS